ncbi:MAG: hypothetical protein MZV63_26130 [Marinilabiliales bacterium]|nr:hypothetical protein [Marinilabiliales bacterium]
MLPLSSSARVRWELADSTRRYNGIPIKASKYHLQWIVGSGHFDEEIFREVSVVNGSRPIPTPTIR